MGRTKWRWLVIGIAVGLLCLAAGTHTPNFNPLPSAASAADAKTKPKDKASDSGKAKVEDVKVEAGEQAELPLLAPGTAAATGDAVSDDLGAGVTATGKSGAKSKDNAKAADKTLPFDSERFVLSDRQEGLSLFAQADSADSGAAQNAAAKPVAKPGAKLSAATKPKPPAAKAQPAVSGKAQVKPAAKPAAAAAKPKAPPSIKLEDLPGAEIDSGVDLASQEVMPGTGTPDEWRASNNGPQQPGSRTAGGQTLKEFFDDEELQSAASDSTLLGADPGQQIGTETAVDTHSELVAGVIQTQRSSAAADPATAPTVGDALRNPQQNGIGSNLAPFSPWRSGAVVLACLSLGFLALWAAGRFKGVLRPGLNKNMAVIESITVAPGRQIVIVEMHGDALVLGITPQSINLLDKLPLERFSTDYSSTVQTIINREATALPAEWAKHPSFAASAAPAPAQSRPASRAYVPPLREKVSVGELRRARASYAPATPRPGYATAAARPAAGLQGYNARGLKYSTLDPVRSGGNAAAKDELISRLRSQLGKLEG